MPGKERNRNNPPLGNYRGPRDGLEYGHVCPYSLYSFLLIPYWFSILLNREIEESEYKCLKKIMKLYKDFNAYKEENEENESLINKIIDERAEKKVKEYVELLRKDFSEVKNSINELCKIESNLYSKIIELLSKISPQSSSQGSQPAIASGENVGTSTPPSSTESKPPEERKIIKVMSEEEAVRVLST